MSFSRLDSKTLKSTYDKKPTNANYKRLKCYFNITVIIILGVVGTTTFGGVSNNLEKLMEGGNSLKVRLLLWQQQQQQEVEIQEPQILYNDKQQNFSSPLMFQACNGFGTQRLSIAFGVLAGILSGRNIVLPQLPLDGEQHKGSPNIDSTNAKSTTQFHTFYNITQLQKLLTQHSLKTVEFDQNIHNDIYNAHCSNLSLKECLKMVKNINKTINIGCGFPSNLVQPGLLEEYENIFMDILNALVPVDVYQQQVEEMVEKIGELSGGGGDGGFSFLHLRVEQDWLEHCAVWSNIPDGIVRDNCLNNTENVGQTLAGMIEDKSLPLVITYSTDIGQLLHDTAIQSIVNNGFNNIIISNDLIPQLKNYPREIKAMINYFVGLNSNQFIGNSVTAFSALMILERRSIQKWASYYNGGNIPYHTFVPLYQMPWVLVDNCNNIKQFNKNVLPVLIQGIIVGQLDTYLYCRNKDGKIDERILEVAKKEQLNVILDSDIEKYQNNINNYYQKQFNNSLYAVSMYYQLRQYNYIFYTSRNVWFERKISLDTFVLPLPRFRRDYLFDEDSISKLRLINSQNIRNKIMDKNFEFSNDQIVEQGTLQDNVISMWGDNNYDTPIKFYKPNNAPNKWQLIRSCQYEGYKKLQNYCQKIQYIME